VSAVSGVPGPGGDAPRGLRGLAALLALVVLAAGGLFVFWFLPRKRAEDVAAWSRDLGARADLRREALTRYFENGLGDAATLAGYPANPGALAAAPSAESLGHVRDVHEEFLRGEGAYGVSLWRTDAVAVAATRALRVDAGCRAAARDVLSSGVRTIGMHLHEGLGPLLTFTAPVAGAPGVVSVAADPAKWLYGFLARPLAAIDSGEAALLARDGGDLVLLSPLRDRPDAVLRFRGAAGSLGFGARAAFAGSESVAPLVDYRGVRVLATGRALPPSPWVLGMKVDEAEALAAFHADARRSAAALAAFLLGACALVWGLVQRRERLQQAALAAERQRQSEVIRHSEERYRALFDGMRNGFAYCEMLFQDGKPSDFIYLAVNRAFSELTGLSDVVGRRVSEVIPGIRDTNADLLDFYGRVAATGTPAAVETFVPALGIWFAISAYSTRKDHFVAIFDNVTERRNAEAALLETQRQLAQAQKMEAVGRLAGGIAHDFNNLLTVIRGYGELLAADLEGDAPKCEELGEILRAAERASGLTRQLLAFSRRQTFEMQALDLGEAVAETERMLRRLIGEDIRLEVDRPPRIGTIRADRGQIEQVILNLAVNARDAMPHGGALRIALSETAVVTTLPSIDGGVPPGLYVVLTVADAGCGMSRETLEHAFEPFFTTKETGKGTGLGLSTVFGIVKQSGGHLRVTTAPGAGATFDLFFPRDDEAGTAPAPAGAAGHGGAETILVAEDEPSVRDLAGRMLAGHGYRILLAAGGDAALAQAEAAERVDLLLTDLVMPGMSGAELADRLSTLRPGLRVLFMSGYPHDVLADFGVSAADVNLLRKPFTDAELSRRVRETLDGPAPSGLAPSGIDPPRAGGPAA
jgi:signal transduction histidine kinase/CheY-like chemotaxis protein